MATCLRKYIFLLMLCVTADLIAQKKSYDGQGSVSEIIMASPAEVVGHFDMFYSSKVAADEVKKQMYWYKIVFTKDCSFDFTLFPLAETDRYSFVAFKSVTNMNYCEAKATQKLTRINEICVSRKYNDTEQSEAFRSNLVITKKVAVKAGEVVYLVIKNLWGKDQGHIIGLNTCDYSYVLEVQKPKTKPDSLAKQDLVYSELQDEEALAEIGRKLCPPDTLPVKLGTVNFNKKVDVSNQMYVNGESKNSPREKIQAQDIILPPAPPTTTLLKAQAALPVIRDTVGKIPGSKVLPQKPNTAKQIIQTDTVPKKSIAMQHNKSNLPKTEIWLKGNTTSPPPETSNDATTNIKNVVPVKCVIINALKGSPIDNAPVITDELTGKHIPVKKLSTGEYEILIEKKKSYKVECNVIGYRNFDHSMNIYKAIKGELSEIEIALQPLVAGENFILKNIYFNTNTPVIRGESNKELEKLYQFMKTNPDAIISIEGHTNSNRYIAREKRRQQLGGKWAFHGTAHKLSKYRADEVKDYLIKKMIDENRVKTKGWGGDRELYPNARTIAESMKNMRVEVVIIKI